MKPGRFYRVVFFCSLLFNSAIANPPLRLIIQFNFALNNEQQLQFKGQLNRILSSGYSVLSHSSAQRWIISFKPANEQGVDQALHEIKKLQQVKYVESDQVLNIIH